jgi:hypothetical protein
MHAIAHVAKQVNFCQGDDDQLEKVAVRYRETVFLQRIHSDSDWAS